MELRQIQYFIQLYTDCNMTKASQTLFISQQGLSKSMINLEEELGFPLFERSASGVFPTDSADRLYHFFQKVLNSYHNLNLEVEKIRARRAIKIAAPIGFSLICDRDKFLKSSALYPEPSPSYVEYDTHSFPSCLEEQKADIAFMLSPIPEKLQSHLIISKEPLYAVVSNKHSLSTKNAIFVEDLYNQNLLLLDMYENSNTFILKNADFKNIPYHISKKSTINEFLPFIYSGTLVGFSTKLILQYFSFRDIQFIPIMMDDGSNITVDTHLVTLKNLLPDKELQQYIEYEKELHKNA